MLPKAIGYLPVYIYPQKELLEMKRDNQMQIQQKEKEVDEVEQAKKYLQVITDKHD